MEAAPITLKQANAYVKEHHRHSLPTRGCRFALACLVEGRLIGVAVAGRPVARCLDDGRTLEITRVCTDGTPNACSFLYGRMARIARLMGYQSIVTYTLEAEDGASLKAVGARAVATVYGRQATCPSRPRRLREETPDRVRWQL